jgi:hypothetical protein
VRLQLPYSKAGGLAARVYEHERDATMKLRAHYPAEVTGPGLRTRGRLSRVASWLRWLVSFRRLDHERLVADIERGLLVTIYIHATCCTHCQLSRFVEDEPCGALLDYAEWCAAARCASEVEALRERLKL